MEVPLERLYQMVAERNENTEVDELLAKAVITDPQCEVCGQPAEWQVTPLRGNAVFVCADDQAAVIRILNIAFPKREVRVRQVQ